ncbi:MAG: fimbrillin family protein, partial [Bacteroidales bacterium]|nr:fimbrillin family protein [Bacteroidales bacterium]
MKSMIYKSFLLGAALLSLASCMDEAYGLDVGQESSNLTFTATMDEQDWYGVNVATRSADRQDDVIPTSYVTPGGERVNLVSHELYGISGGKGNVGAEVKTRAVVSQAIDTRSLSISQVGWTQHNGIREVKFFNLPAVTTDGEQWSCNEFFVNRQDFTALRVFGALFPYNENYSVKDDDYEGKGYMEGTNQWLYQFRADYELASDNALYQEDLLYAKQIRSFTADQYAEDGPTPLVFRHAMTAVKVKLGSAGFVPSIIKEVRLKNVHNKGTFHFFERYKAQTEKEMVNENGWWEVSDSKTSCVAVTDFDTQGEYNCYVTGDAATFMMIPQELPEDAVLELDVVFTGDAEQKVVTISAPIGRHGEGGRPKYWNIGTTHEYVIDTKENANGYYMVVEGMNNNDRAKYVSAEGGDASLTLKSYKSSGTSGYAPLKWQYIGWSTDGEDWSDEAVNWLHMNLSDGTALQPGTMAEGTITGQEINISIDAMAAETGVSHAEILRSREAKGSVTDGA